VRKNRKTTVIFSLIGEIKGPEECEEHGIHEGAFERLSREMAVLFEGTPEERAVYDPILIVKSGGGDADEATAIRDLIHQVPQGMTTLGIGEVASAATFVFLAGRRRLATPATTFVFHEPTLGMQGNVREMTGGMRGMEMKMEISARIIAEATKMGIRETRGLLDKRVEIGARAAKAKGIIHQILRAPLIQKQRVIMVKREQNKKE
jgi:ATP-dependent Clp protease protease subunit